MIIESLGDLRKSMSRWFSLGDIKSICFDLNIPYEEVGSENLNKSDKIRELIRYVHKHNLLLKLVKVVKNHHETGNFKSLVDWDETIFNLAVLQNEILDDKDFLTVPPPKQIPISDPNYLQPAKFRQASEIISSARDQITILGLHGMVGVGKSALAIHLAMEFQDAFKDGILWANLNSLNFDSELIKIGMALGQGEKVFDSVDISTKAQFIRQLLSNKNVLLVINQADSNQQYLEWLLPQGKRNVVVVTTRNISQLERINAHQLEVNPFGIAETLKFLGMIISGDRLRDQDQAVIEFHSLLGGNPQAISLAAHQMKLSPALTVAQYNTLIENEKSRIKNIELWGESDLNIAASLEVSYADLPNSAFQETFAILGVFEGLTLDSIALSTIAEENNVKIQLILGQLANRSLIKHIDSDRYEINPLVKSFALSKLEDSSKYYKLAASYFAQKAWDSQLENNFSDLNLDWQNVVGLMNWAFKNGEWELLKRGVLGLTQYHLGVMGFLDLRGYWQEARDLIGKALQGAMIQKDRYAELKLRLNLAGFSHKQSAYEERDEQIATIESDFSDMVGDKNIDFLLQFSDILAKASLQVDREKAAKFLNRAIDQVRDNEGNKRVVFQRGYLLSELSGALGRLGEYEKAKEAAIESLKLLPSWPSSPKLVSLINLGLIQRITGEIAESTKWLEDAVVVAKEIGDVDRLGSAWTSLGINNKQLGKLHDSLEYYDRSLNLFKQTGNIHYQFATLMNMGQVNFILGDFEEAGNIFGQALKIAKDNGLKDLEATTLSNLADIQIAQQNSQQATKLLEAALDICDEIGIPYLKPTVLRQQLEALQIESNHKKVIDDHPRVLEMAIETKDLLEQGIIWRVYGVSQLESNLLEESQASLEKSVDLLKNMEEFELARTQVALSRLLNAMSKSGLASQTLNDAINIFEKIEARFELMQARN